MMACVSQFFLVQTIGKFVCLGSSLTFIRGKMKNYGAFITLDNNLNLKYNIFKAADPLKNYASVPNNLKLSRNIRRVRSAV